MVDESSSIGPENYNKTKSFLSDLVGKLDIDSGTTRVGLATYSTTVRLGFHLGVSTTVAAVQSAISSISYFGGLTNTAAALRYVRTDMLTIAAGDRRDVPNVVAVLTDGESNSRNTSKVCA